MKTTIIRRLESLETEQRTYEQKEKSSRQDALLYIWTIVLAYYVGDLRPEDDHPHYAFNRVLKLTENDLFRMMKQRNTSDYHNRLTDACSRFFAARGFDVDQVPVDALYAAFIAAVNELPDKWLNWLRSNLKQYCDVIIGPGSNLPRWISPDNFLL